MTTRAAHIVFAATTLVGGCSIIYNPDNIPTKQDAAIIHPDANPAGLMVTSVTPSTILEGQGDGGSRPAILVIQGANFIAGAQVELMSSGAISLVVDNSKVQISTDAHFLAVPVTAHVDQNLHENTNVALSVKVTQMSPTGPVSSTLDAAQSGLVLKGLDELDVGHVLTDWSMLRPLYSQVDLKTKGTLNLNAGTRAARIIVAVSSIEIDGASATGDPGNGANGGAGGAGGCQGGGGRTPGSCNGAGGGAPGAVVGGGGGGGGGGAAAGSAGTGAGGGGSAGIVVGDDAVAMYTGATANQAGGGGGGAGIAATTNGGGGGGGGGLVELTAGGNVKVGAGGVNVNGGDGGSAFSFGGGGGAGGVIVVRAGNTLTTTMLVSKGGMPGPSAGAGSPGRVRWDAASGAATGNPTPVRGVAFASETPLVVMNASDQLTWIGTPNHQFGISTLDGSGMTHTGSMATVGGAGMTSANVPWTPGLNHVCITLAGGMKGHAESDTCLDVAYLP
jgi:hypothetical protein